MSVAVFRLTNVRNYVEAEFLPAAGVTVVHGANGSGKSTLLEALSLFATLSSPRTGNLGVLVRHGASEAGARLETDAGLALEIRLRGGRSLLKAGGSGTVARSFLGRFRAVLFTPEDLDLVRGEPSLRRRALDDMIVQLRPAFRGVLADFDRALRQRNAALRQGLAQDASVYDAPLAAAAAHVLQSRRELVRDVTPAAIALYDRLAGNGTLGLSYKDSSRDDGLQGEELEAHFRRRYAEDLHIELERGSTRAGPHRDDLDIEVDGVSARSFASRGEQRSAALAFRLAQLGRLPGAVLLLDDVLSELDPDRRSRLFETIGDTQTIVTATEREVIPVDVESVWSVDGGVLRVAR